MIFRLRPSPAALLDVEQVLDRVTDGIVLCDRDHRFVYANAAAERLLGVRRKDLVGRLLHEVYPHLRGEAEAVVREVARRASASSRCCSTRPAARWTTCSSR